MEFIKERVPELESILYDGMATDLKISQVVNLKITVSLKINKTIKKDLHKLSF